MSEYIERGALLKCAVKLPEYDTLMVPVYAIQAATAADVVEVKHGRWVEKDCVSKSNRGRVIHYVTNKCSVCGKWNGRHKHNYCPNCGAKMDGGADNG